MPVADAPKTGKCFNCDKDCTQENFCFGCRKFICEKCDVSCGGYGFGHRPEVHLEPPDDGDDE